MATLKIGDLSVGDWVHYDKGNTPYSIRSIYHTGIQDCVVLNDEVYSDGVIAFVDKLNPIPITPEILEANGFEPPRVGIGFDTWFWSNKRDMALELRRYVNDKWHLTYQIKDKAQAHLLFPLYHIHELQHIIRLLHIDKEINV